GIICGTGYVAIAGVFTLLLCGAMFLMTLLDFGRQSEDDKYLKITIPESLNYDEVFDGILKKYCRSYEPESVKTLTLGSLFRVEYRIVMKDAGQTKQMIDEIRTRNGNLEIMCGRSATDREEL
ncbi:MAG: DUF4956 domain-containing protein, partial [Erysipelotrichaceae bacterium]|nr:DUF4956 domain-containing protein [Erysipelotrichaceae bacterium]